MTAWRMLTWELVARRRWLFCSCAAYLALVALVCAVLPPPLRDEGFGAGLAMLLVGPALVVMAGLAHGFEGRLEGRASIFPARLFTLPVSNTALAGPPLLLGTLFVVAGWLVCATCVLRPCGAEVPVAWPAAWLAACLAWCQALVWSPFRLPWLRLAVMAVVLPGLLVAMSVLAQTGAAEAEMTVGFGALVPLAYVVATVGVARARHGVGQEEPALVEPARAVAAPVRPFSSPLWAQVWLEWRLNRWGVLFLTGLLLAGLVPGAHLHSMALRNEDLQVGDWPGLATVAAVGVGWLAVSAVAWGPVLLAVAIGADLGRMTRQPHRATLPPFFGTLPVETASLLRGKLVYAGLVMLFAWALFALVGLAWSALAGYLGEMADRLVTTAGSPLAALTLLGVGFLLAVVVSWLWVVRDLWAALAGWRALAWVPLATAFATWVAAFLTVHWWLSWPEARPVLVVLLLEALALKVGATGWVVWRTHRQGLLRPSVLAGAVAGWLVLAALVGALVCWLADGGAAAFAGVLLLLPLARPLAAPLALARNRHR